MREKLIKLITQFFKFGIVGVSNTAISLGCYYVLVYFGVHYLVANAVGFVLSVCNSYFWNSRYVFKEKQETNNTRAFVKVVCSYSISLCVSTVLLTLFVQVLGISEYLAPILRLAVTVPMNYVVNKLWVFKERFQ